MRAALERLEPAATPAQCVNWLAREDLTRMAVKAYEMARLACFPRDQPFLLDGDAWSDRETFLDALLDNLQLMLRRHGWDAGVWISPDDAERLDLLEADYRARCQVLQREVEQ